MKPAIPVLPVEKLLLALESSWLCLARLLRRPFTLELTGVELEMGVLKVTLDIRCAPLLALLDSLDWPLLLMLAADDLGPALALTRLFRLAARLLAPP